MISEKTAKRIADAMEILATALEKEIMLKRHELSVSKGLRCPEANKCEICDTARKSFNNFPLPGTNIFTGECSLCGGNHRSLRCPEIEKH